MTRLQRSVNRETARRADAGFTLIELLVVIVILGILAAVVVFAVTGVGDKGKASAVTIDARTIRTAEEAYCGQNGRYGSGQELVTGGFMSELPTYHVVGALNTGGNCNGWNYSVLKTPQAGTYPQGSWQTIANPPFAGNFAVNGNLDRLPDGRVIATFFQNPSLLIAIWDPATGAWTAKDSSAATTDPGNPFTPRTGNGGWPIVLRDDPATPGSECGSNCGKLLVHLRGNCPQPFEPRCQPWKIFDPNATSGSQWQPINLDATFESSFLYNAGGVGFPIPQFKTNCGTNCGKVLVAGGADSGSYAFFEPRVNGAAAFSVDFPYPAEIQQFIGEPLTLLPDGRILLAGMNSSTFVPGAFLFDPTTNTWTPDTTPPFLPANSGIFQAGSPTRLLPTGQVLFAGDSSDEYGDPYIARNLLYTPVANGPGSWTVVNSGCVPGDPPPAGNGPPFCQILSSLPDGRVLAHGTNDYSRGTIGAYTGKAFAFDPVTQRFSPVADPPNPKFLESITLDPRFGACGVHCGKVLAVGNQTAGTTMLFTP